MKKLLLSICLVCTFSVCQPSPDALGAELDPGFGQQGITATGLGVSIWAGAAVELAAGGDGATVVLTTNRLLRYLPNGQLDLGFGSLGAVTLEEIEGLDLYIDDVAIDPAGRIVAFGTAQDPDVSYPVPGYLPTTVHPNYAVVLRFDAAGRLDPGFGGGDGIVRTDLGRPSSVTAETGETPSLVQGGAGTVDARGRPIFIAAPAEHLSGEIRSYLGWANRLVVRLTPAGDLDPSFGGDGIVRLRTFGNRGLSLTPAGHPIYVWGSASTYGSSGSEITRLGAEGTLHPRYGFKGVLEVDSGGDAVLDRFGRLVVLDRPGEKPFRIFRLKPSGRLDTSFGRDGQVVVKAPGKRVGISSLAVDRGGRVLLVGASAPRPAKQGLWPPPPGNALKVGRLKASGSLDRGFGRGGWLTTRLPDAELAFPSGDWYEPEISGPEAALDNRGGLIVAASSSHGDGGVVLARYTLGP